jgi:hypothetical protein
MSLRDTQTLDDIIAEYQDILEIKSGDLGRTEKVYHTIDTGDPGPFASLNAGTLQRSKKRRMEC